jgi:fermentation-respiration switch protein FrsA (DUF1100 family)
MVSEDVEFRSGGETVRGDLYLPAGDGPFPVIVMAGGWCYVKELRQPHYAGEFVERGFAALVFDYRNVGASDGVPRQHLDPWQQIDDYRNAITYLSSRPDIDADRIGAWGISYSGGHVLILGAIDPRVKAIVSNVPVVDGYQNMWRVHGTDRFRRLQELCLQDRVTRFDTGQGGTIAMSGTPAGPDAALACWPLDEVKSVFMQLKQDQAPRHEHWSTIESVELLMQYHVAPYARRLVQKPVMMIVASGDDITLWDMETEVFESIPSQTKELVVLPGTSHMTLYSDVTSLDLAATAAGSWFSRHLFELPTIVGRIAEYDVESG